MEIPGFKKKKLHYQQIQYELWSKERKTNDTHKNTTFVHVL